MHRGLLAPVATVRTLLGSQLPYNWLMWHIRVTLNGLIIAGNAMAMLALFFTSLRGWGDAVSSQVRTASRENGAAAACQTSTLCDVDRRRRPWCLLGGIYDGLALCRDPLRAVVHALDERPSCEPSHEPGVIGPMLTLRVTPAASVPHVNFHCILLLHPVHRV